jgi:hypothetical protein
MSRSWLIGVAVLVAATVGLVPRASAFNPQPDPPGFEALVADINALPAVQNSQPFLAKALAAREAALRGQPCVASKQIGALRNQVAAKLGKKDVPDQVWGQIDADAVRVLIGLLQDPNAAGCGGTASPARGNEPQVDVTSSDVNGLTLHVTFPQATFTPRMGDGQLYLDMGMDGLGSPGVVGQPNVPALTRFFALPVGADASVDLLGSSSYLLDGIHLWPQQDEAADPTAVEFGNPAFAIDRKAYSSNVAFPASPVGVAQVGTLRDLRVGGVETDGAQYNPVTQSLRVYTGVDLRVKFGGDRNTSLFGDTRMTSLWNLGAQQVYQSSLLNYAVAQANIDLISRFLFCGEEYLIVTTHALDPAAETLATHRRADGISTRVVTLGTGDGDIGTTKEQIQSYIRSQLTSSCLVRPSYVGILGDTAQVPTWKPSSPWPSGTGFDGLIASDLPYALANNADLLPDLAIGRMPAPNLAVATDEVAKIVAYEDSPPFFAGDFYNHATVTSYFQCGIDAGGQPCNPGTRDERTFSKLSETVRNGMLAAGKTVDRVYTTTAVTPQQYYDGTALPAALLKPGFAWNGTGADVTSDWNAGRFLILHRDHGAPSGWGNPSFGTGDIPGLTNGAKLPVVFSINCASGKFDDASPNFSEQLVEKASGGAVGVIGDSRNSPSNTNSHLAAGLIDAIFPATLGAYGSATPIRRMGDVLVAGKQYMNTQNGLDGQDNSTTQAEEYLYHWFGDPTMPIWLSRPSLHLKDTFSATVLEKAVLLKVSDGSADGAVATLYAGDQAIGRALVEDGVATIVPEAPIPVPIPYPNGDAIGRAPQLTVVVDQDGYVPAQVTPEQAPTQPIG